MEYVNVPAAEMHSDATILELQTKLIYKQQVKIDENMRIQECGALM